MLVGAWKRKEYRFSSCDSKMASKEKKEDNKRRTRKNGIRRRADQMRIILKFSCKEMVHSMFVSIRNRRDTAQHKRTTRTPTLPLMQIFRSTREWTCNEHNKSMGFCHSMATTLYVYNVLAALKRDIVGSLLVVQAFTSGLNRNISDCKRKIILATYYNIVWDMLPLTYCCAVYIHPWPSHSLTKEKKNEILDPNHTKWSE